MTAPHKKSIDYLYENNKLFRELHKLMFISFGWSATEVDTDIMKIWRLIEKYGRVKK